MLMRMCVHLFSGEFVFDSMFSGDNYVSMVNKSLKTLALEVAKLADTLRNVNIKTHLFRKSGTTWLAQNHLVQLAWIIHRGGWKLDGRQPFLGYIAATALADMATGRALTGWSRPTYGGKSPDYRKIFKGTYRYCVCVCTD